MADVNIYTNISMLSQELSDIINMTYFFNPNFDIENSNDLPVVFFYMTSFEKQKIAEINTEPLIIYDDSTADNRERAYQGTQRVVADNIVLRPANITFDAIVPYRAGDMNYFINILRGSFVPYMQSEMYNLLFNSQIMKSVASVLVNRNSISGIKSGIINNESIQSLIKRIFITNIPQIDTLEKMMDNKLPLKLKLPFGWKFTQAIITDMSISKTAEASNCVFAKINCLCELPVIKVVDSNTKAKMKNITGARRQINSALFNIFNGG